MSKFLKNKPRLGRGLSSLLSSANLPVEAELPASTHESSHGNGKASSSQHHDGQASITALPAAQPPVLIRDGAPLEIPLEAVVPNPHQPRRTMDEASIAELAASLKATGLIQPIVVRRVGETYQLIAGERRWRASKVAGLAKIPAIIRDVDSFTQARMALVENIQRENLNPIDRALAYRTLMNQLGLTQAELAGRLGEDRSSIANHLRLLDLAEPVQAMIGDSRLSLGHAKILAGVPDILEQQRLANLVVNQELSVRNLERLIKDPAKTPAPPTAQAAGSSAYQQELEKSISRQLGMKCQLRPSAKKGKGRLVIQYATLDQFDDLLNRLGVSSET